MYFLKQTPIEKKMILVEIPRCDFVCIYVAKISTIKNVLLMKECNKKCVFQMNIFLLNFIFLILHYILCTI